MDQEPHPFKVSPPPPKKKTGFFVEISPKCGWVGWLIPKQGPNPSKPPQIAPKITFFDPNFTFRSPKSHKNPGVGGWVNRFGRDLLSIGEYFYDQADRKGLPRSQRNFLRKSQKFALFGCMGRVFSTNGEGGVI